MNTISDLIETEQLRTLYQQLPTTVSAIFGGALLVYLLWGVHPPQTLLIWFGFVIANHGIAAGALFGYYHFHGKHDFSSPNWRWFILLFIVSTGCIWGSIGVLFYTAPTEYKLLIVVWLWALGSGMSSLLVAYRPAFYTIIFPVLVPLTIRLALDNDVFYQALSAATFVWTLSLLYFHHSNYKTMFEAISLRFINTRLVDELTQKNSEIEAANLAKSQFLAAASHDLRQPLHAQSLFLAELDHYVDAPVGRRIMGGLESTIYAMRNLLNAILDISKLDAGVVQPSLQPCAIQRILDELASEFEPIAADKQLEIVFSPCDKIIITDQVLLGSILRNLAANALRYTEKGRVLVSCHWKEGQLRIDVTDTGIGIPEEKQSVIFAPFFQLGNPERNREKGLGLGLSIVQRIADLLGYTISIQSTENKGSTFSVGIPVDEATTTVTQFTTPANVMTSIAGKRILVIDDDDAVRSGMLGLLKSWGSLPVAASNTEEAVVIARENVGTIDIIVADFRLPGDTTGIQAIQAIQAVKIYNGEGTPAALITGDTSPDRLREASESHFPILHKPVMPRELNLLLGKLVRDQG